MSDSALTSQRDPSTVALSSDELVTQPIPIVGPVVDSRTNLPSLTGLRWLAALLVFAFHLHVIEYFGKGDARDLIDRAFEPGIVGVSFFFILSGFVLMWSSPRTRPGRFWYRRFARVYPLHLATAVLALLFVATCKPKEFPTASVILSNLTLTHTWVQDVTFFQSLNTVSWTLACEAFFYLLFPLFAGLVSRLRAGGALLLAGVSLIVVMVGPVLSLRFAAEQDVLWFWHWNPLGRFPEFLLGVALARFVWLTHDQLRRHTRLLGLGAVVVTFIGYYNIPEEADVIHSASYTAAGFGLILVAAAVCDIRGRRLIWSRPTLVKLGELSFAFYLIHLLVIRVLELDPFIGSHPKLHAVPAAALTLMTFSISVAAAWLLHAGIEKPARRLLVRR
ncbi:acyltransferase [Paractinoplanes ferrugineus]|uniref:Acyltransferase 3 domain-containing protein n=1 Tax=Paractinoplanes ferrugineus TaxID=113564 RepID=A0A919M7V3_9ACTN|nr:acyltransferase [Actinoplanes ferrugineus]GIE09811.1 hypothetical protein Afe05nite_16510 [Actinoplanes ferrugineus]